MGWPRGVAKWALHKPATQYVVIQPQSPPTFSCAGVTDHAMHGAVKLILRVLSGGSARLLHVLQELGRRGHPREVGGRGEEFGDKAVQLSQ